MSALPAERGKGLWKTPSEAHSRIWQSRGCRESGNVEGISLRTGKWLGAEKTPGEGPGPECRRVQGGAALPGQGEPPLPPPTPPPGCAAGGGPVRPAPPTRFCSPRRRARRAATASQSRNFASLLEAELRASSLLPRLSPAPISASRAPPSGRDLLVYRGSRTPLLPHRVGGCRGANPRDTSPGHAAGPRPGAGRPARRFRPLRPPPRAFLPPPHPSPAPSFPAHARAAPPGREEERAPGESAQRGQQCWGKADGAPHIPAGATCATGSLRPIHSLLPARPAACEPGSSARPRPAPPPPGAEAKRCGQPGCGALDAVVRTGGGGWMQMAPIQLGPEPLPANSPRPIPAPRRTKI